MLDTATRPLTRPFSPARELVEANSRLERRVNELLAVQETAQSLVGELRLNAVLEMALATVGCLAGAQAASILLLEPGGDRLVERAHLGGERHAVGTALAGWVAGERVPLLLPAVEDDAEFHALARRDGLDSGSFVGVPLLFQERLVGVVCAAEKAGGQPFTERDLRILICLAPHLAIAIRNATLYADLEGRVEMGQPQPGGGS